jgi:asparagine synthase (glutamine-hydrolysing)
MCGICGILAIDPEKEVSPTSLERMSVSLNHRGPDDEGSIVEARIGLAMRRLAIIDLEQGHQPMANESGDIQAIQNGEIYNFGSLREQLRGQGHQFATHSDTEVIVHLYEEQGLDFAKSLRGMYAIAIWDRPRQRLVLARDPYGIKPLLYTVAGGLLTFSSELKSLLASRNVSRTISPNALRQYLMFNWTPGTDTILDGVKTLEPGHMLISEGGDVSVRRFAGPRSAASVDEIAADSDDSMAEQLLDRLRDSVKAHLVADVPVGVLLSGGVDSSLLAALAAEQTTSLKTFSIGFDDPRFNELPQARLIAERYSTDHHELVVDPDITALLPRLVETFDQPLGDSSTLPTFLVSELATQHVKVALSGEGGDELFGGYNSYAADLLARRIGPLASLARPIADRLPDSNSRFPDRAKRFARGASLPPMERHCSWLEVWSEEAINEVVTAHIRMASTSDPLAVFRRRYAASAGLDWLTRFQDLDVGTYLVGDLLMKTDLASMAHSLEIRVPFLDHAIADFAYGLKRRQKVRGRQKKWLLRHAARNLLPSEVLNAPKRGFSIPAAAWLRNELSEYATDTLSESSLRRQGFFEPTVIQRLLREHIDGRHDHSRRIWGVLTFTLWADRFGATLA